MLYNPTLLDNNIITSRIRLARNVADMPFRITDNQKCREIIKAVSLALGKSDNFSLYYLSNMTYMQLEAFKERHLISQSLIDNKDRAAVFITSDEKFSIMVHEEDVLREQGVARGLRLHEIYKKLNSIDDLIAKKLNFAFDKRLGYLTACPTNVGTGLRASVMLFLPALTESGKIKSIVKKAERLGLAVRGVYGEGSKADGFMYQVSNEVTLGVSESELVSGVENAVLSLCEAECNEEVEFYGKIKNKTEDECFRALGILSTARILDYKEFLSLAAKVKLGISLKFFDFENPEAIDDLMVAVRPMNLCYRYGIDLTQAERDRLRAEFTRESIIKIVGKKGNV